MARILGLAGAALEAHTLTFLYASRPDNLPRLVTYCIEPDVEIENAQFLYLDLEALEKPSVVKLMVCASLLFMLFLSVRQLSDKVTSFEGRRGLFELLAN